MSDAGFEEVLRAFAPLLPRPNSPAVVLVHEGAVVSVSQNADLQWSFGSRSNAPAPIAAPHWTANDNSLLEQFARGPLANALELRIGRFGRLEFDMRGGQPTDYWLIIHGRCENHTERWAAPARSPGRRGQSPAWRRFAVRPRRNF